MVLEAVFSCVAHFTVRKLDIRPAATSWTRLSTGRFLRSRRVFFWSSAIRPTTVWSKALRSCWPSSSVARRIPFTAYVIVWTATDYHPKSTCTSPLFGSWWTVSGSPLWWRTVWIWTIYSGYQLSPKPNKLSFDSILKTKSGEPNYFKGHSCRVADQLKVVTNIRFLNYLVEEYDENQKVFNDFRFHWNSEEITLQRRGRPGKYLWRQRGALQNPRNDVKVPLVKQLCLINPKQAIAWTDLIEL